MNIQGIHQDFRSLITKNKALNVTHTKPDLKKLEEPTVNKLLLSRSKLGKVTSETAQEKCAEELDTFPPKGWLVHSSDKDPKEWRHMWRIEENLLTLFLSESESLFYKQIPLSGVTDVKKRKNGKQFQLVLRDARLTVSPNIKDINRCKTATSRWYSAIKKAKEEAKRPATTDTLTDHSKNKGNGGIFEGIQFALDLESSSFDAKKQLRELITGNGGQISYIITGNTKWLVVCAEEKAENPTTYKQRKAVKLGIPIMSEKFIRRSVEEGNLLEIDVSVKKDNEKFSKGRISAPVLETLTEKVEKFDVKKIIKYKIDDTECPEFSEEFHVPKYSILEIVKKEKKVVCVEAHIGTLGENEATTKIFRVMVSSKLGSEKVSRFTYPVSSISNLTKCYETLVRKFLDVGMKRFTGISNPEFSDVVSEPLGLILSEMKTSAGKIHPEVVRLIESVWTDSVGELKIDMGVDPENITPNQVRSAMIALLKIEEALKCEKFTPKMSDEFYKNISPRNARDKIPIDTIQKVAKKREMCQLIKDIVTANENSWLSTKMSSAYSQYTALKCAFTWLDPQGTEFKAVKDLLPDQTDKFKYTIRNIFKVNRTTENFEFRRDLPNKKLLFHASAAINFVGIFSRGLLMPSTVTSELGIARRDEGNLGSGIYFSDSFEMSSGFATKSQNRGTRLMLVNEVVLGKTYDTHEPKADLVSPPDGFHSVKGIELAEKGGSEFAIYNSNQQRMKYAIEFTLNNEMAVGNDTDPLSVPFAENSSEKNMSAQEISENMDPPVKQMRYGLVMESKGASAKLEEVHIRAKIIDLVSEVTLFQSYVNTTRGRAVEAKYVFPLADNAAVCGFEAFINEKHVIGEVKEKEEAHREYKKAVAEGHGAYLMDEEKPNVFTVSVGNIPVHARVVIKITYIVELETVNEPDSSVLFILPGSVAQWEQGTTLLSSSITQSTTESVAVSKGKRSSLMVSVDMPFDILDINSPTHKIVSKKTVTKACVKLQKTEFLGGNDFRLLVKVSEIHIPRIWIETDGLENDGEQVAMVTFFPEFDFDTADDFDCTILLDMSTSMAGPSASYSKHVTNMLIDKLPEKCNFNVLAFGSNFEESFIGFENASNKAKDLAKTFVSLSQPCRGGSDLLHILNSVNSLLENKENQRLHNIFLLSDGHLSEEERILRLASRISKRSFAQTRIFTFGIGGSINSHLLHSLSVLTGGRHEHFSPSTKNTWKAQLQNQITFAAQPALTDVRIDWCNYENTEARENEILHVPEKVKCVFSGCRLTAYSFLPGCKKVTLNAKIHGKEFSTVIMAHGLSQVKGKTLHRLATKAVFKEYESGRLAEDGYVDQVIRDQRKSSIISLSVKYSVVSKFTSFIAVEKRDKDEDMSITSGPPVNELVEAAFEDIIPETGWGFEGMTTEENIDELLKRSAQLQTGSILQARELALQAKALCEKLPTPDNIRELKVSAALYRLNATPENFDACKVLNRTLKTTDLNLNYDVLNSISRCKDSLVLDAIGDLASSFWPDYCTVQLASLPQKLRPLAVGFFVTCCSLGDTYKDVKKFVENQELIADFWNEMHNIDMKERDDITVDVMRQLKKAEGNMHAKFVRKHRREVEMSQYFSRSAYCMLDDCSSFQESSIRAVGEEPPEFRTSPSNSYKKFSVAPSYPQRRSKQSSFMWSTPSMMAGATPRVTDMRLLTRRVATAPRSPPVVLDVSALSHQIAAVPPPPPRDRTAPIAPHELKDSFKVAPPRPPQATGLALSNLSLDRAPNRSRMMVLESDVTSKILHGSSPVASAGTTCSVFGATAAPARRKPRSLGLFSAASSDKFQPPPPASNERSSQVITGGGSGSSQGQIFGGVRGGLSAKPEFSIQSLSQAVDRDVSFGTTNLHAPPPGGFLFGASPGLMSLPSSGAVSSIDSSVALEVPNLSSPTPRSPHYAFQGEAAPPQFAALLPPPPWVTTAPPPPPVASAAPPPPPRAAAVSSPPPLARSAPITPYHFRAAPPEPPQATGSVDSNLLQPDVPPRSGRLILQPDVPSKNLHVLSQDASAGTACFGFGGTAAPPRLELQSNSLFSAALGDNFQRPPPSLDHRSSQVITGGGSQGFRSSQKQVFGGTQGRFSAKPAFSILGAVNTGFSFGATNLPSRRFEGSSLGTLLPASIDTSVALEGTKLSTPRLRLSTNTSDDSDFDLSSVKHEMVPSSRAAAEEKGQLKFLESLEKKQARNLERIESRSSWKTELAEILKAPVEKESYDDRGSSNYARKTVFHQKFKSKPLGKSAPSAKCEALSIQSAPPAVRTGGSFEAANLQAGGSLLGASLPGSKPPTSSGAASTDRVALGVSKNLTARQQLFGVYDEADLLCDFDSPPVDCEMVSSSGASIEEKEQLESLSLPRSKKKQTKRRKRIEGLLSQKTEMPGNLQSALDAFICEDACYDDTDIGHVHSQTGSSNYAMQAGFQREVSSKSLEMGSLSAELVERHELISPRSRDKSLESETSEDHSSKSESNDSFASSDCLGEYLESSSAMWNDLEGYFSDSKGSFDVEELEVKNRIQAKCYNCLPNMLSKDHGYAVQGVQTDARSPITTLIKLLQLSESNALDKCLDGMEDDGFCKFPDDDEIDQHGKNDCDIKMLKICKEIVIASGGRSLGSQCLGAALNMLLTSIMLEILKEVWIRDKNLEIKDKISLAEKWLKRADAEHPLLYRRLELGFSWEAAARNVITKMAANLSCLV